MRVCSSHGSSQSLSLTILLELLRCQCSFVRPHRVLKFGHEVPTPAMQAGIAPRQSSFREIYLSMIPLGVSQNITSLFFGSAMLVNIDDTPLLLATYQHWMAEAPLAI